MKSAIPSNLDGQSLVKLMVLSDLGDQLLGLVGRNDLGGSQDFGFFGSDTSGPES